jgi:hypothetical protein
MQLSYGHEPTPTAIATMGEHLEITLHFTPEEAAALGSEAGQLAGWFLTALRSLAALRTGTVTRETDAGRIESVPADLQTWYWALNDLHYRLMPRLSGIGDAAIRAHADQGGSLGNLADAMEVARSTAQSRREKVTQADPSHWENWARTGGPQRTPRQSD